MSFAELADPGRREHFVYRAFDEHGRLLYVGCTMRPKLRLAEHRAMSRWIHLAVRWRVAGPYNYDTARHLEREALATERPVYAMTPARRGLATRGGVVQQRYLDEAMARGLDFNAAVDETLARYHQWRAEQVALLGADA